MDLTTHHYRCLLTNSTTGRWDYYLDDMTNSWWHYEKSYWINQTGNVVEYMGEVWNLEDDMPGTNSSRCVFSALKYYVSNWTNTNLTDSDMMSDNISEWGYNRINGTNFEIWDKDPLP